MTFVFNIQTLRLTNAAKQDSTVGEIINLMSVDAEKIGNCMWSVNDVWAVPLLFSISFYFLWQTLGMLKKELTMRLSIA